MEIQDTLGKDYIIEKRIGSGGQAVVYLVTNINEGKKYVAKLLEKKDNFKEEQRINEIITKINPPNPYILKYIKDENGDYKRGEKYFENVKYFILEYASQGDLYKYIKLTGGFGEKFGKLLFYKILLGIQGCHKKGIYHMDIKLNNILVDFDEKNKVYNPKICDFGYSIDQSGILTKCRGGTKRYVPPQILYGKEFTGEKVDIFYLGSLLFNIVFGINCFGYAKNNDKYYKKIKDNDKDNYFKIFENHFEFVKTLDESFKDLLFKMLAYEEEERPKNIDEILKNEWFDQVSNNREELENGLYNLFIEKEDKISKQIQNNNDILKDKGDHSFMGCRSIGQEIEEIFPKELKLRKKNIELGMDSFIKFKGNFNYYKFMNEFLDRIKKEFSDEDCIIDDKKSKNNYECDLIFELKEKDEEENENEENEKDENEKEQNELSKLNLTLEEKEECIINLELYQSDKEEYILRFIRTSGSLEQFYVKVKKLISLANNTH